MKIQFLILGMLFITLAACNKEMAKGLTQGVTGTVLWFEGNLMPSIGATQPKGKAIERAIVFCKPLKYKDLTQNDRLYTGLDEFIVETAKSDAEGKFSIKLPVGKYSVFTKEEGGYYANSFDGQGFIQVIEVMENKITTLDLKVDYKAVY